MVFTTLTDRIGNNLFQIATGASLAHRHNTGYVACISDMVISDGISLKSYLNQFRDNIFRKIDFMEGIPKESQEYIQPCFEFREIPYREGIRLTGYFQSEKFFDREYVRDLFSIDSQTRGYILNKYGFLQEREFVSINVRRGDYLNRPLRQPICEMPYFRRAIRYLGKEREYLIISDDIEWCKTKFRGKNFVFIDDEPPLIDLYLQTFCKHNIISNSTFSWWGAWLDPNPDKIVIAPKKWFGIQMRDYNTSDLLPEGWIKINNPRTLALKLKISLYWSIDILKRVLNRFLRIFKF